MPAMLENGTMAMYVAAAVALVVVLAFFVYLWSIDRRIIRLRQRLDERQMASAFLAAQVHPRSQVDGEGMDDPAHA